MAIVTPQRSKKRDPMPVFGDDSPQSKQNQPSPGEDLYGLSVSELDERITLYQSEIARLEAERIKKQVESDAAHALFGKKP